MSWILIEGLDRSGKSTITEHYKKQGYEVIHMEAPNGKYFQPGYGGPSYLEEIVEMYNIYEGKQVVFDRTIYGESVWPEVYNRMPLLNDDDVEYLSRLEYNNNAVKYLMYDEDLEAHWQRCADNKEPLNRVQFIQAGRLYDKLATKHNFQRKQLTDFDLSETEDTSADASNEVEYDKESDDDGNTVRTPEVTTSSNDRGASMVDKLKRANAIRVLLETKIVKKQQSEFKELEQDIKQFLTDELENIFAPKQEEHFTTSEVYILKTFAKRVNEKQNLKE